jgi:predicted CopG family antitoxin
MSEFTEIKPKVRYLLGDIAKSFTDPFIYNTNPIFTLTQENVTDITSVFVNSSELSSGDYSFDPSTNKVTLETSGLTSGDNIEIIYEAYTNYSDSEIEGYIKASLVHLSTNNFYTFTEEGGEIYPDPTDREINLIAIITSILISGSISALRLPDMTINFNEKLSVSDRIKQTIAVFKKTKGSDIFAIL